MLGDAVIVTVTSPAIVDVEVVYVPPVDDTFTFAVCFFGADFFAGCFFAACFLAGCFFTAAFFAGAFLAACFFGAAFFGVVFFDAITVDTSRDCWGHGGSGLARY